MDNENDHEHEWRALIEEDAKRFRRGIYVFVILEAMLLLPILLVFSLKH